jgi:hypothetical protein
MRRLPSLALLAVLWSVVAAAPGTVHADPTPSQQVFTQSLLDDPGTSPAIKSLLSAKGAIVDPRSGFVDVTGDGRQDALILVTFPGAAGSIGLYVFSTHGQTGTDTKLRVIFRLQSLYRATLRLNGTTLSVLEPRYAPGDDLCCPQNLRERDYRFVASRTAFRRVADHEVPFTVAAPTAHA